MGLIEPLTVGIPLDGDHLDAIARVRARVGLPRLAAHDSSHVSLAVVTGGANPHDIDDVVVEAASRHRPFGVRARGFGVFDGGSGTLVLHVPVVRTDALARLHRRLHSVLVDRGARIDGHYDPSSWFPHVTLWRGDLDQATLRRAVLALLAGPPIAWTVPVDALAWFDGQGMRASEQLGHRHLPLMIHGAVRS